MIMTTPYVPSAIIWGDTFLEVELLSQRAGIFLKLSDQNCQTPSPIFLFPTLSRAWVRAIVRADPPHRKVTIYAEIRC